APRSVHGKRERRLAGPDGVPPLRRRTLAGRPRRTGPGQRTLRRPVLQPARAGLRDRPDNRPGGRLSRRGRPAGGPERTARRRPRRPHLGRAGGAESAVCRDVSRPAGGRALGLRRRGDRRGSHGAVRGGDLRAKGQPSGRGANRRGLPRGRDAGVPAGQVRPGGSARKASGGERLDHAHRLGAKRPGPGAFGPRLYRSPAGRRGPGHDQGGV
ncbi:MAG: hypothetical protein AVDCRST_MAG02-398, partial [uncultured Rubrobacteraceae bacterium]